MHIKDNGRTLSQIDVRPDRQDDQRIRGKNQGLHSLNNGGVKQAFINA